MRKRYLLGVLVVFVFACYSERNVQVNRPVKAQPERGAQSSWSNPSPEAGIRTTAAEDFPVPQRPENSKPELTSVKLVPEVFRPGDALGVEASARDADGDEVELLYEWSLNGEIAGNTNRLARRLKRGDHFSVSVIPFDGKAYGRAAFLEKEIVNMPPTIIEEEKGVFVGSTYTYQVKAVDPDGDSLTYSLKNGPEGMSISPVTGFIKWDVPADYTGPAKVSLMVEDGNGGQANYELSITIKSEPPLT